MNHEIAVPIRRFFEEYLTTQKGLSSHTVLAYRDGLKLLLRFVAERRHKPCTRIVLEDLDAETIRQFLNHLEKTRHNKERTRNARLAALRTFFGYLAFLDPRYMAHAQAVQEIPFKKHADRVMPYLEHDEIDQIFQHIEPGGRFGRRDQALLRMLYTTGVRASELVNMDVSHIRFSVPCSILIHGKGKKERTCPLRPETLEAINLYLAERDLHPGDRVPLFINAQGRRLTRFGLRNIVIRRVAKAAKDCPSLLAQRAGPHTFRHSLAMRLLQSDVDMDTICHWLGHESLQTTNGYVHLDLDMKKRTLQACEKLLPKSPAEGPSWRRDDGILNWLSKL